METFLISKRIHLKGLNESHLQVDQPYFRWLNDLSLDEYTERSIFPNNQARMLSYYNRAIENNDLVLLGIFDNETEKHIGNITFQQINWFNRNAFIAYLLGDASFAGKGIVTEAVLMMMYYGFNRLNFERIWGGVSDLHDASKKVCEKTGLKVEGKMRHTLLRNGTFSDSLVVGSIRDEWMSEFGETAKNLFVVKPTY
jgi:[ribosomal protein S5]-alanine N-acetyltransferase